MIHPQLSEFLPSTNVSALTQYEKLDKTEQFVKNEKLRFESRLRDYLYAVKGLLTSIPTTDDIPYANIRIKITSITTYSETTHGLRVVASIIFKRVATEKFETEKSIVILIPENLIPVYLEFVCTSYEDGPSELKAFFLARAEQFFTDTYLLPTINSLLAR